MATKPRHGSALLQKFISVILLGLSLAALSACAGLSAEAPVQAGAPELRAKAADGQDLYMVFINVKAHEGRVNRRCGFIDRNGKMVIEPKYDDASLFTEGLAAVELDNKWGFIDTKGAMVIAQKYDYAEGFYDGLACVALEDKRGFINQAGEVVIDFKYRWAYRFLEGISVVREDDEWFSINKAGQRVTAPNFDCVFSGIYHDGLASVVVRGILQVDGHTSNTSNGKSGFMDKQGNLAIPDKFDSVEQFSEGLAAVEIDRKWGFINQAGEMVIAPQYNYTGSFNDGLCSVLIDNRWGAIDKTGKLIFEAKFTNMGYFTEGLCPAADEHFTYGFIDKSGQWVIAPQFFQAFQFSNGLAEVRDFGNNEIGGGYLLHEDVFRDGYIDKTGQYIWQSPELK